MKHLILGGLLIIIGIIFCVSETAFYGWNIFPMSVGEKICDGISILLYLSGLLILAIGYNRVIK